jgi:hypothetical protein
MPFPHMVKRLGADGTLTKGVLAGRITKPAIERKALHKVPIPANPPDSLVVPSSAWAMRALITDKRDAALCRTVKENDEEIKALLRKPINTTGRLKGVIYALRHDEIDLVKLGQTTTTAESRRRKIQNCCKLGPKTRIIAGEKDLPLRELLRLEQFILIYFRPHRVFFK